jgi:2-amino-4-hydroxy-6-hydroxymethyldihydropteridine diphosphokinase
VLKPLADLAPDLQHPVEKLTMRELWQRFPAEEKTIEIDV